MSNAWNKTPILVVKDQYDKSGDTARTHLNTNTNNTVPKGSITDGSRQKNMNGYPSKNDNRNQKYDTKARNPRQQQQTGGNPARPQSHSNGNNTARRVLQRPMAKDTAAGIPAWGTSSPSFVATPSAGQGLPKMHPNGWPQVNQNSYPQHQIHTLQPMHGRGNGPIPTSRNTQVSIIQQQQQQLQQQQQQQQQQDFPDFPPLSKATATSAWGQTSVKSTKPQHTNLNNSLQTTFYPSASASTSVSQGQQQHPLVHSNTRKSNPKPQPQKNSKDKHKQPTNPRKRQIQSKVGSTNDPKSKGKRNQSSAQTPDGSASNNNNTRKKIDFHKPALTNPSHTNMIPGQRSQIGANDQHGASIHAANMLPMGTTVKGKQKIGKRKKIFTSLKKQILKERLMQWRENQGMDALTDGTVDAKGVSFVEYTSIVYLQGYIHLNEVDDDDEYQEIQNDLVVLAERVGSVSSVHIPRHLVEGQSEDSFLSYVKFKSVPDALAASACWDGMVLGGDQISVGVIRQTIVDDVCNGTTEEWKSNIQRISHQQLQLMERKAITAANQQSTVVILTHVLTEDDLEDDDCLEETLRDIRSVVEQHGPLNNEKDGISIDREKKHVLVEYQNINDAKNAVSKMNGTVLGGVTISANLYRLNSEIGKSSLFTVCLENILSEDDYEDEECLEATKEDIEMLASEYGKVDMIDVELGGDTKGRVNIFYKTEDAAKSAVEKFNGIVIGGLKVLAWIGSSQSKDGDRSPVLVLQNVITQDDFEDEDCMEETKCDLQEMLRKYGEIKNFELALDGEEKGNISVIFQCPNAARKASNELHESMIGGCKVAANVRYDGNNDTSTAIHLEAPSEGGKEAAGPMYSGDKVIPEQYAECKRAPKVPNTGVPREYAKRINDESIIPLLFDMLSELMRLQIRAKDNKNAKARRRLVMGLREVCRGIRARKVKMIVMANNVDQYGALDVKLQEILDLAKEHDLPVIFELNKRKIGKALGKTIKVSVVGIENADGAYEPFKKLKHLYGYA